jgi:dihydrofolate reductase
MKVFIIASLTADGFVARDSQQFSMDWTSPEDVKHFVALTKEAGALVMGSRTFQTIVDAKRRLPGRTIYVYSSRSDAYPADIRPDPTIVTSQDPQELVEEVASKGFKSLAVCGGAQIYDLFMRAGVVTDLHLTIEPKLFGKGVPLFAGELDADLKLESCRPLNDNTLALHYTVKH